MVESTSQQLQQQHTTDQGKLDNKFLITEVPASGANATGTEAAFEKDFLDDSSEGSALSSDEDEHDKNQYFHVDNAEPPTNYDDPYSTLPPKIKLATIKRDITQSVKWRADMTDERAEFEALIKMDHCDALIADAFWYFICAVFKADKKYEAHNEFLLDRMAANYVSYTLVEDPRISYKTKQKFFWKFYNYLSQAVYHCLKTAFPKNRNKIETNEMKRKLLNTFSELFTGVVIHSAKYTSWTDSNKSTGQGPNANHGGGDKDAKKNQSVSLADVYSKGVVKSKRQKVTMKYSPLVERYLMTHKYETMNNVRGWKMLITQRTEAQKEVDKKFKAYKQMAEEAVVKKQELKEEVEKKIKQINKKISENKKQALRHIETLQEGMNEKLNNGMYNEYANMVVSIFNSEHLNNIDAQPKM